MLAKIKKLKQFNQIIQQLNTEPKNWRLLGSGSYGRAYDMGDGRACKITTNEHEAKIAKRVMRSKKKLTFLYRVSNVFFITTRKKSFKFGLIITPKYRKLTDNQKTELYELFNLIDLETTGFKLRPIKQVKKIITKAAEDYYFIVYPQAKEVRHNDRERLNNIVNKRLYVYKKYNIYYMLRDLKACGLRFADIHYENILKNKDKYVLIDLAC